MGWETGGQRDLRKKETTEGSDCCSEGVVQSGVNPEGKRQPEGHQGKGNWGASKN